MDEPTLEVEKSHHDKAETKHNNSGGEDFFGKNVDTTFYFAPENWPSTKAANYLPPPTFGQTKLFLAKLDISSRVRDSAFSRRPKMLLRIMGGWVGR